MSLVIDDAYIESVKQYLMTQCNSLDYLISRYIRTMNSVIEAGFMNGMTSDALKEFLKQVESDIGKNSANPGLMESQVERFCIDFVKKVDKTDKELY